MYDNKIKFIYLYIYMTNLLQFDLSDVPEHPSIVLAGRRRSGKGVLAKDLCYNFLEVK